MVFENPSTPSGNYIIVEGKNSCPVICHHMTYLNFKAIRLLQIIIVTLV